MSIEDLKLPHGLQVFVKDHDCHDHIEKLYYACGYKPCCIQCGEYLDVEDDEDTYVPTMRKLRGATYKKETSIDKTSANK